MIIIEGLDGVGKSTICEKLKRMGYSNIHYNYELNDNLVQKYTSILSSPNLDKLIADRSFFSELTYGKVLRNGSRISDKQFVQLLKLYSHAGAKVIYLTSDIEVLLQRRQTDEKDFYVLSNCYNKLTEEYHKIMKFSKKYLPILHIDTSKKNIEQTFKQCETFILGGKENERTI